MIKNTVPHRDSKPSPHNLDPSYLLAPQLETCFCTFKRAAVNMTRRYGVWTALKKKIFPHFCDLRFQIKIQALEPRLPSLLYLLRLGPVGAGMAKMAFVRQNCFNELGSNPCSLMHLRVYLKISLIYLSLHFINYAKLRSSAYVNNYH